MVSARGAGAAEAADADDDDSAGADVPTAVVGGVRMKLHAVLQKAALRSRGLSGAGAGVPEDSVGAMSLGEEDWSAVARQLGVSPLARCADDSAGRPLTVAAALRALYTASLDSFVRREARAIKAVERAAERAEREEAREAERRAREEAKAEARAAKEERRRVKRERSAEKAKVKAEAAGSAVGAAGASSSSAAGADGDAGTAPPKKKKAKRDHGEAAASALASASAAAPADLPSDAESVETVEEEPEELSGSAFVGAAIRKVRLRSPLRWRRSPVLRHIWCFFVGCS